MFRFRRMSAPFRSKVTPFVLAASAAGSALACMDDTARIILPEGVSDTRADGDRSDPPPSNTSEPGASETTTPGAGAAPGETGATPAGTSGTAGTNAAAQTTGSAAVPAGDPPAEGCWALPVIDRARLLAPDGQAASLVGGKIVGSTSSPTNGFVDLAEITEAPAEGEWVELAFANTTAYRYVKYYGPGGSHGALAELELFAADERAVGVGFGSAGSLDDSGTVFDNALDGDTATFFEGPLPNDNYVGLDLGAGHELGAPAFSPAAGAAAAGDVITLSAPPDTSIWYTVDGSDPTTNGVPYAAPITLSPGTTLIKAVSVGHCALPSTVASAVFDTGEPAPGGSGGGGGKPNAVQSSMHIGNSLTDTINDLLPELAADGGIALDYNRYTIPGAGTWMYDQNPTGGFGVANVQEALRTRSFDHLTMQPFPNYPCQVTASADGDDSDSGFLSQAWTDAMTQNPNVQMWVYQQWPAPADWVNCISGGGWTRGDWAPPEPTDWESAAANELTY
ncbi:MAG TPA: chitobiase/beta-hexosaminidase C-terminal domain-containing protein, partial [Polyangiaceae bacterium]|nr:chitobiase/beta-hexosaminidase C-terminal domain-containing protein [Polyangiaceae bacterium]